MLEFIGQNLPAIICALVGVGLLVLEAFMPGFGLAGISGVGLEIAAVVLMYNREGTMPAAILALVALSAAAVALTFSLRSAAKGKISQSDLVLRATEATEAGYVASDDMQVFLGKEGISRTTLRPTGVAEFDGVRLNVLSDGEFIPPETPVKVMRVEGSKLFVRPVSA
ncbi:MAG: hypothetical protein IK127_07695 [Clostridia bacterium]|nr:hypothetical protein [Clostridia bacterium]